MRLIAWDESLSVNSPEIDNQHREIIDQINSFFGRMMHGEGLDAALQMVATLSRVMSNHFRAEESLMSRANYLGLAEHRVEHQDFLSRFDAFKRDVESGRTDAPKALFEFCANWLKDHIHGEDLALASFLQRQRAG
jgi:hemerythrin-like metal-binding protein